MLASTGASIRTDLSLHNRQLRLYDVQKRRFLFPLFIENRLANCQEVYGLRSGKTVNQHPHCTQCILEYTNYECLAVLKHLKHFIQKCLSAEQSLFGRTKNGRMWMEEILAKPLHSQSDHWSSVPNVKPLICTKFGSISSRLRSNWLDRR